jgi:hypothetical protein
LVIFVIGWATYAGKVIGINVLHVPQEEQALLGFLETLPKDVLLAGSPCALDNVPLFAKRQILFSCEQTGKDDLMRQALKAYYAEDGRAVVDFCQRYRIDHLVVDLETYSKEYLARDKLFFEPYNRELLAHIAGRDTFALAQVPDDVKAFQWGDLFVVPCEDVVDQER